MAGPGKPPFNKNPTGADTKGVCTRIGVKELSEVGTMNAVPSRISTESTVYPPVVGEAVETRSIPFDL